MDRYGYVIIIPAFNEGSSLGKNIDNLGEFGPLIIVDDGSTDSTSAALEVERSNVHVVKHEKNLGYDAAINSGFKKAVSLGYEAAITLDADGQHDPNFIKLFINQLENGKEMVLGVRDKPARISERIFSYWTSRYMNIQDPLCGMKAYKLSVYKGLGYFDSYCSIGTELMLYGYFNNYEISEININIGSRDGKSKMGNSIIANYKIIRAMILGISKYILMPRVLKYKKSH